MKQSEYFLIDKNVLPPVFEGVIYAKELLSSGSVSNASQAAKAAGISRSAFYKYKDYVFKYTETQANTLNLSAVLTDKAGVFSAVTSMLYNYGANIITANQSMPVDGSAVVSLTVRTDNLSVKIDTLLKNLRGIDGVVSINSI